MATRRRLRFRGGEREPDQCDRLGGTTIDTTHLGQRNSGFDEGECAYEFTGVSFTGSASFEAAPNFFFVSADGTGDGSSVANAANGATLVTDLNNTLLWPNKTIVLINDGNNIVLSGTAADLDANDNIEGFGNGNSVAAFTIPVNVIIDSFTGTVGDPTGKGAATLTISTAQNLINLNDGNSIQNVDPFGRERENRDRRDEHEPHGARHDDHERSERRLQLHQLHRHNHDHKQHHLWRGQPADGERGHGGDHAFGIDRLSFEHRRQWHQHQEHDRWQRDARPPERERGDGDSSHLRQQQGDLRDHELDNFAVNSGVTLLNAHRHGHGRKHDDAGDFSTDTLTRSPARSRSSARARGTSTWSGQNFTNSGTTAANVINVTGQTGGTINFDQITITGYSNAGGTAVNLQGTAGTVAFTDLDITASAGAGLSTGGITFAPGSSSTINTTGGTAVAMNGTTLSGGTATFASVSATNTGNAAGISLANTVGTTVFTTVNISGTGTAAGIVLNKAGTTNILGGTIDGTTNLMASPSTNTST